MMFSKRSMFTGVFVLAFALASIGTSSQSLAGKGGTNRPFKGVALGRIAGQTDDGAYVVHYEGRATHLGRFTRTEMLYVDGSGNLSGTITFWAANGDELHVSLVGQVDFSSGEVTGKYTLAGGTGRFSGADGKAQFEGLTDLQNVKIVFSGTISY